MSVEYLATDADLTAVANAIRAKGGTSAQLVFPGGFVSAVRAIQTGIRIELTVTTKPGAEITVVYGNEGTVDWAGADGTCVFRLDRAGEYTVTVEMDGLTRTETIQVGALSISVPLYDPVFANNSWEQIAEACRTGTVPETWTVGSSKSMTINGTEHQVDIIGLNHDDYADGSGKAPLTFQLHDSYTAGMSMNSERSNSGGWASSRMRTSDLPSILSMLPSEVRTGIREVSKLTAEGAYSSTIGTTADKLFLLSEVEIFGSTTQSSSGEGTQYAYYAAGNSKIKSMSGTANRWWERSPRADNNEFFCVVSTSGTAGSTAANATCGVSFAFCF